ncbi:serine/threonine-protein kinase [Streptomyces sp. NPDC026673]|uniref:serine/threonine-protein kinase n=1 Tax=Streptomyces sp. NPDC026673 TaxID=3155724 RepID=UPI0033D04BE9
MLAGRYRLGDVIGRGGMGRVWEAQDVVLRRTVAVKELTLGGHMAEDDRAVLQERMKQEARAAARINHPHVVTVHDVLEEDGRPWIVMELVDGRSLDEVVRQDGPLPPRRAAAVGAAVLEALRAAHAAGVLHRDVKPGNVLLARDGRVLLTDFGIAVVEGDSAITRTGELVGSVDYLAPERARGGRPGPASDLWSLGATLYAAVEGRSPFRRTSPIGTLQAVVYEELPEPRAAGPLRPVIAALLAKDPAARPPAGQLTTTLAAIAADDPRRTPRGRRPGAKAVAAVVAVALLAGAGAVLAVVRHRGDEGVPAGYVRVHDPAGFSLAVPRGWQRQLDGDQIDYTPDGGAHRLRIGVGRAKPGLNPYMHLLELEKSLRALPDYTRVRLHQNTFRGRDGGLWEFTWTDSKEHPGPRRAVDQAYVTGDGTEYALYMGAPADDWAAASARFQVALQTWRVDGPKSSAATDGPEPSAATTSAPGLPAGFREVADPAGFSLALPEGFRRSSEPPRIYYYSAGKEFRVGIRTQRPDPGGPEAVMRAQDASGPAAYQGYRDGFVTATTQNGHPAALWQFTWDGFSPGEPRRTFDLCWEEDGRQYDLWVSSPLHLAERGRGYFDTARATFDAG